MVWGGRAVVALALVGILVTTAGCSGLESTEEREPYGVDEEVTIDPVSGLDGDGVTDSRQLRNEHARGLETESYRMTQRSTLRDGDGTLVERSNLTALVAGPEGPTMIETELERPDESPEYVDRETWIDGETAVHRLANDSGEVRYERTGRSVPHPSMPIPLVDVYDAVDAVERDGDRYHLEGTAENVSTYEHLSVAVTITDEGIVESYRVEGTDPHSSEYQEFEHRVEIEVAPVDPEAPSWLEEVDDGTESEQ